MSSAWPIYARTRFCRRTALLASLPLDRLQTPRQVAAYVGLCPHERSSGSSLSLQVWADEMQSLPTGRTEPASSTPPPSRRVASKRSTSWQSERRQ
jgi:hypothetical protein